jgi:hypothetical protein
MKLDGPNPDSDATAHGVSLAHPLVLCTLLLPNRFDAAANMNAARKFIGYAPQFDALIDLMTGRELITMFAYLRGLVRAHPPTHPPTPSTTSCRSPPI